jgi:hypothetical protein
MPFSLFISGCQYGGVDRLVPRLRFRGMKS